MVADAMPKSTRPESTAGKRPAAFTTTNSILSGLPRIDLASRRANSISKPVCVPFSSMKPVGIVLLLTATTSLSRFRIASRRDSCACASPDPAVKATMPKTTAKHSEARWLTPIRCSSERHSPIIYSKNAANCPVLETSTRCDTTAKRVNPVVSIANCDAYLRSRIPFVARIPDLPGRVPLGHLHRRRPAPRHDAVGGQRSHPAAGRIHRRAALPPHRPVGDAERRRRGAEAARRGSAADHRPHAHRPRRRTAARQPAGGRYHLGAQQPDGARARRLPPGAPGGHDPPHPSRRRDGG